MKLLSFVLMYFVCYIPIFLILAFIPYLTRRSESFGVGIPEEIYTHPEVKQIRKNYRNRVLIFSALCTFLGIIVPERLFPFVFAIDLILILGLVSVFYLVGHRRMKSLKAEYHWIANQPQVVTVDTSFHRNRNLISPWWFLLHPAIIIMTVMMGFAAYPQMPERVPIHFDLNGVPNGFANKSPKLILLAPIIQLFIAFLTFFVYWMIAKAKQQVESGDPERSLAQNRIFRQRMSVFTVFGGCLLLGIFSLVQGTTVGFIKNPYLVTIITSIITGIFIISAVILAFTTGQGGSRVPVKTKQTVPVMNRDDDQYWKQGVYYFNPQDPSLFIEKRFGIGWTINFGRPLAWVIIIGLLVGFIAIVLVSLFLTK